MFSPNKYLKSVMGGSPKDHHLLSSVQLIIGACFAGYTVTHLPPKFLELFERPYVQFVVFYVLFNTSHGDSVSKFWIFVDALLFTTLMNVGIYVIKRTYGEHFSTGCCKKSDETVISGSCEENNEFDGEDVECPSS
jgi:hypothetical protein